MSLHHTFLVNPEELDFGGQLFFRSTIFVVTQF